MYFTFFYPIKKVRYYQDGGIRTISFYGTPSCVYSFKAFRKALGINKTLDFVFEYVIFGIIRLLEYFVRKQLNAFVDNLRCTYFNNWVGIKNYNYEK